MQAGPEEEIVQATMSLAAAEEICSRSSFPKHVVLFIVFN